jgi:BTB/POZ domain/Kelch motif
MTLTALRGRLYLFGGSGTSAKCFQDLQILDRHEMAWLDVVHVNEQPQGGNNNCNSNIMNNGTNAINIVRRSTSSNNFNSYDRFRFGGKQTYGRHDGLHTALRGDGSSTFSLDINAAIASPLQRESTQNYVGTSEYNSTPTNNFWTHLSQSQPLNQNHHHHHLGERLIQDMVGPYTSPNPNDEDTVPSILIRGNGPGRRAGHTATAVNRKIYVFGGSCGSDYLNDFFVLDTDPPPSAVVTEANPLLLIEHRLHHFCNDPEFADVVFFVGDSREKVYAHKMVLSIVSDCFRAMFTTGFKESAATEISIPDCSHKAFLSVMEYIYSGHLPAYSLLLGLTADSTMTTLAVYSQNRQQQINQKNLTLIVEMLELADRFFLDHLKQICESMLQLAVQFDTVEYLLATAQKTNSLQLQAICQHFYRNHFRNPSANHGTLSDTASENI